MIVYATSEGKDWHVMKDTYNIMVRNEIHNWCVQHTHTCTLAGDYGYGEPSHAASSEDP